jgi:predicted permease
MAIPQDVRQAFRIFRRSPLHTGIALLSISLSVAASSVVFAAIKSVLIDPLPFTRPAELVQVRSEFPGMPVQSHGDWVVWNDVREISNRTRTLQSLGIYGNTIFDLSGDAGAVPEALYGVRVTAGLFPVLGVSPMIGRNILPDEDQPGHPSVMILSYGLWARRFQPDRSVVGRSVTVNGHKCQVIGVMPPEFNFPMRREAAHTPSPYVEFWSAPFGVPNNPEAGFGAVARLRPGVSLQQARQDLADIGSVLARQFPATNRNRTLTVNSVRDRIVGTAGQGLSLLMGAAIVFMLIGCANVANLLLARGLARQQEFAIRLAIGASPSRLARQLLTESCVLALLGGLSGYLLTVLAWKLLPAIAPVNIARLSAARADISVLGFALAIAILNGILFGIAPAVRAARSSGRTIRANGPARHDRIPALLVTSEVALSVLLVVVGAQVLASFARLATTAPGFHPEHIIASVVLPAQERYPDPGRRGLFYGRILTAVGSLPGVRSAGTVDALPFSGENHGGSVFGGELSAVRPLTAEIDNIGGEYLQAMEIQLRQGRWFREDDLNASSDTAIVNTLIARTLWPGGSALGQKICIDCTPGHPVNWKRVIGVVSNASHAALDEPEKGNVYLATNGLQKAAFLIVRTERPAGEMGEAIRRTIAALDPNQPVLLSVSMGDLIADSLADRRFIMVLLFILGSLALILSTAGVYGVISYTTSRRTHEIGIRMAIGATPRNVLSLIFRQGFAAVAAGLAIGLITALLCMRLLKSLMLGLESAQPAIILGAALLVAASAALACWIQAKAATGTNPVSALRH